MKLKCPGCGTDLAEGSEYCGNCRGRIDGSTIDYSQIRMRAGDVYEDRSYEETTPEPLSIGDETMIAVMSIRFAVLMVGLPIVGFIAVFAGLVQHRTDFLAYGVFFFSMFVLLIVLYFKYYREKESVESPGVDRSVPRFLRKI